VLIQKYRKKEFEKKTRKKIVSKKNEVN